MTLTTQEWKIGDCVELMREMPDASVDLIVTDPPYGYSFMGKEWDKAVPSVGIWKECLRILKPGAFAFIMSAPRQDVLAHNLVNLCDAGFETGFTSIYHCYASGFSKAGNASKLIDKRLGAEKQNITTSVTPEAKALDGSYVGAQFKPAVEVIMVVMKPLSEKTYVDQAMTNMHGVTWLDDGRIPIAADDRHDYGIDGDECAPCLNTYGKYDRVAYQQNTRGRFPANLLVSDDVLNNGNDSKATVDKNLYKGSTPSRFAETHARISRGDSGSFSRYFDLDAWWDERIKHLPKEAHRTFPFMIVPKASKSEKGNDNNHPTVKPVKLFSWLITIGSRDGDRVLDPFLGSGTTLVAGRLTNRNIHGFEIDPQWESLYAKRSMTHTPPLQSYFERKGKPCSIY